MAINKTSFLSRIRQGVKRSIPGRVAGTVRANVGSSANIRKLAGKHGIVEGTFGRVNFDKVINRGKEFAKKGDMVGMRNFFKSQQQKAKKQ